MGNWDQMKDVENCEEDDVICQHCCGSRRRNIGILSYFTRSCTRIYIIINSVQVSFMHDLVLEVEGAW